MLESSLRSFPDIGKEILGSSKSVIRVLSHVLSDGKVIQSSGVVITPRRVLLSAHQLIDSSRTQLLPKGRRNAINIINPPLFQGLQDLSILVKDSDESYSTTDVAIVESPVPLDVSPTAVLELTPLTHSEPVYVVGYPEGYGLRIATGIAECHRGNYLGISLFDQVYAGMSGGGVFNHKGRLIGIFSTNDAEDPHFSHAVYLAAIQKQLAPYL